MTLSMLGKPAATSRACCASWATPAMPSAGSPSRCTRAPDIIRNVAIAMYEGEINMVIHANGGEIDAEIDDHGITIVLRDQGPGIPDVEKAMQEGWSTASDEIRAQGFGAGMGLPNMKKYTDNMQIDTVLGVGTTISLRVDLH